MYNQIGWLITFLVYCGMSVHTRAQVPVMSSSDYEELRDEFLQINGDGLPDATSTALPDDNFRESTVTSSVEPPRQWHDDQSSWDVGHLRVHAADSQATRHPDTHASSHPDTHDLSHSDSQIDRHPDIQTHSHSSTQAPRHSDIQTLPHDIDSTTSSPEDDYPEEEIGAEPIGLAAPTAPPQTAWETLEHIVILGPKTTPRTGMVTSLEGLTVEPWNIDQPEDTRDMLPTHPPGTFPGENDLDDSYAVHPLASLNNVVALVSLMGSNFTITNVNLSSLNAENITSDLDFDFENSTVFNGSSGNGFTNGSLFFTGNPDEDSVLILSDAVGPVNVWVEDGNFNVTDNTTGPTSSRKVLPTVLPIHPTKPGIKSYGTAGTHAPTEHPTYHTALWFEQAVAAYSLIAFGLTLVGIILCCCLYGSCCQRRNKKREYQVNGAGRDAGKDVNAPLLYQL